jgi:hypothetical protein
MILRYLLHYGLHFVFPLSIAAVFYKEKFWKAYILLVATMLIDLDHLIANPIFDPNRCSIGFHPLHTIYALAIYVLLVFPKKIRIFGVGLILHLLTDFIDCQFIG